MIKLMKYEFLRRKPLLLGALVSAAAVQGGIVYAVYRGGGWNTLAAVLTVLLSVALLLLPLLNAVTKLYADLKHRTGYMLFLTPAGGSRILFAKMGYAAAETLAAAALLCGCLALSGFALDGFQNGAASAMLASLQQQLGALPLGGVAAAYVLLVVLQMLAQLSIAMLAVTVSRCVLPATGCGWLIALLMYFAFALGINIIDSLLLLAFGFVGDILYLASQYPVANLSAFAVKYLILAAVLYAAWIAGCTAFSGRLTDRRVDL